MWHPFGYFFSGIVGFIVFIFSLALYFLPTIIAIARHHRNALAIFLVDFLTGWTGIGWIIALVWSVVR